MIEPQELELAVSAHKTINDIMEVKPKENVVITIDSKAHFRIAEAMAKASECAGAKTMVAYHSTPPGYGKLGEVGLPDSLRGAIVKADAWIELNHQWLLYNSAWEEAMQKGSKTRYFFLGGLEVDQIWRCIGAIDLNALKEFMTTVVNLTKAAKEMRITNPAGTDVSFKNVGRNVTNECHASTPGPHFLLGQIGWAPLEESINGDIVFDGSFSGGGPADLGILSTPIKLVVEKGKIVDIVGGDEAKFVKNWLAGLNDKQMYNMAHVCYGFNPGAQLSGLCTEDERVWGSTEWGFGYQGPFFEGTAGEAVTHCDGICLNSSVWIDGKQILDEGAVIEPTLAKLAKKLGK
ncbi:MAG: leucyl aminopeptidase [Proteobacteria bacterium]|nr:leucyl aminopeptidase [Pseudomonadota bacterium]